jgi:hypothetical protein
LSNRLDTHEYYELTPTNVQGVTRGREGKGREGKGREGKALWQKQILVP